MSQSSASNRQRLGVIVARVQTQKRRARMRSTLDIVRQIKKANEQEGKGTRKNRRVSFEKVVQCLGIRGLMVVRAQNISQGGICLETGRPLELNTRLKLYVPLPKQLSKKPQLCFLTGRVVWSGRGRVGLQFEDASNESLMALRAYLAQTAE